MDLLALESSMIVHDGLPLLEYATHAFLVIPALLVLEHLFQILLLLLRYVVEFIFGFGVLLLFVQLL